MILSMTFSLPTRNVPRHAHEPLISGSRRQPRSAGNRPRAFFSRLLDSLMSRPRNRFWISGTTGPQPIFSNDCTVAGWSPFITARRAGATSLSVLRRLLCVRHRIAGRGGRPGEGRRTKDEGARRYFESINRLVDQSNPVSSSRFHQLFPICKRKIGRTHYEAISPADLRLGNEPLEIPRRVRTTTSGG